MRLFMALFGGKEGKHVAKGVGTVTSIATVELRFELSPSCALQLEQHSKSMGKTIGQYIDWLIDMAGVRTRAKDRI